MSEDSEPARPPPPKSYVPITLMEGPTPTLPPRPVEQDTSEPIIPPRPQAPVGKSAAGEDVPAENSDHTPVKLARQKGKKAPPKPPVPYDATKKAADDSSKQAAPPEPKPAPRRHTMAAGVSRPTRPKPPPPAEPKAQDFNRPKYHPPEIMTESLYTSVKKNRPESDEIPVPSMPAPPPPYCGSAMAGKPKAAKAKENSPEYMPVGGALDAATPLPSQAPPPGRPARPPAATDKSASSRSSGSNKTKKSKGKKKLEIVIMDAKPMDGDFITSPSGSMSSPSPTPPPTKPSAPPVKRPSPPEPKRHPPIVDEKKTTPAVVASENISPENKTPQPPTSRPAARPSPPQPEKNLPPSRPAVPRNPPAPRPAPPQPQNNSKKSSPQLPKTLPAPRPSPPPPSKNLSKSSPPQLPKNTPAPRPPPPQPNPPSSSRPPPPQPNPPPSSSRPPPPQPNPPSSFRPPPPQPNSRPPPPQASAAAQSDPAASASSSSPRLPIKTDAEPPKKPARAPPKPRPGPDVKRPPGPRPARKEPLDLDVARQLSELGPPPDEEPPEVPTEVTEVENTAAAFLDNDSDDEKGGGIQSTTNVDPVPDSNTQATKQPSMEQEVEAPLPVPRAMATPNIEAKKASVPAGRPPPPRPVKEKSRTQGEDTDVTKEDNPTKKEKTGEKIPDDLEGVAAPPKKAPARRPPPPRQASFQSGGKKTEEKKAMEVATADPAGSKTKAEQESSADKTEASFKQAAVMKRPPAPRPQSRPRSMMVNTTQDSASNTKTASSNSSPAASSNSSPAVPSSTETDGNTEGAPAAIIRRPPAPRPSSRPKSMLAKSASITSSASEPKPARSPTEKKKRSPSIKRPPAPRPSAPKRTPASSKQEAPPPLTKEEVEASSDSKETPETPTDAASDTIDGSGTQPAEVATSKPEQAKNDVKKPTPPVGTKRPPPPKIPTRTETKPEQVSKVPSETSKAVDNSEGEVKKTEDSALALVPKTRSKYPSQDQDKPALPTETESTSSPVTTQTIEQKTLPTLSPNKKLSIKKPPPPMTAKPKSRSPTPSAETATENPSTSSTTSSSTSATTTTAAPALEKQTPQNSPAPPSAPAPISKKPSIKKPPPPQVMTKPKSSSPTPDPLVSPAPASSEPSAAAPQAAPVNPSTSAKPPSESEAQEKVLEDSCKQGREEDITDTGTGVPDAVVEEAKVGEEPVEPKPSQPARPPPAAAARTRPPPPRAAQRNKLSKTPSTDGTGEAAKSPGSPTQVHNVPEATSNQSVSSPEQPQDNSIGKPPEPSPLAVKAGGSPKNCPKPSRPAALPSRSPGLNKKSVDLVPADSPDAGQSSPAAPAPNTIRSLQPPPPIATRPVPPPPSAVAPSKPPPIASRPVPSPPVNSASKPPPVASRPAPPLPSSAGPKPPPVATRPAPPPSSNRAPPKPGPSKPAPQKPSGPPKPPAPSKSGPVKPPAPAARTGPAKPPTPTPGPSKPPPPTARPDPQKRSSAKSQYATPTSRKPAGPSAPPPLPPRPTAGHPLYKYVCSEPHGIANTHHDANDEDELSYQEGDVIELMEKVDDHWYFAANADLGTEGLILIADLNVVKRLPGKTTVEGFEDGPCAVATHSFEGQCLDELSFNSGELIMLKSRYGKNWFRGKLINGKEGIFPKNFVEVVEELPEDAYEEPAAKQTTPPPAASTISGPYCEATFSFTAENPGELDLTEGDQVELVRRESEEWLVGQLRGKEGSFPESFVKIIRDFPPGWSHKNPSKTTSSASSPVKQMSTALYDFDGQEGELSFKAGDKIQVVYRVNDEWVVGEKKGGDQGIFPVSFVDAVPDSLPLKPENKEDTKEDKQNVGLCKALHEFQGESGEELSFSAGEIIETTEKVNDEWLKGRVGSREGMFPVAFVDVVKEIPTPSAAQKTAQQPATAVKGGKKSEKVLQPLADDLMPKGMALGDFQSDEISFKTGDLLLLLTKEPDNQYMGENTRTGDLGTFPASYVDVQVPLP